MIRILLAVLLWIGFAGEVGAQQVTSEVAILDVQRIMRDSNAAVSIRTQTEQFRNQFQTEITQVENNLRSMEQQLIQQQALLTPEAFNDRRREFELRVADLGQLVERRKRQVNQAFGIAMRQVQETLIQVVHELMQPSGVTVVMPRAVVLYSTGPDLTEPALARLNEQLPTVQVVLPAE